MYHNSQIVVNYHNYHSKFKADLQVVCKKIPKNNTIYDGVGLLSYKILIKFSLDKYKKTVYNNLCIFM